MNKRQRFRELIESPGPVIAPGVYDALSARVAEAAGASCVIITGAGLVASRLGVPDVGLASMAEVLQQTRDIARSVSVPLIADCDTGYGNPLNVRRTIADFEDASVSALFIEDQVAPKRCGHFSGKQVIPAQDMVAKLRAAVDVRTDPDLLIIARTDARAIHGPDEAIRRSRLYIEAGAEMIFVEAPESAEELERVATELAPLQVPLMVNLVEGGKTPLLTVDELAAMGYKLITFSGSMQKTAIKAMQELMSVLLASGDVRSFYPERMVSLAERSDILGLSDFMDLEEKYAVSDEQSVVAS